MIKMILFSLLLMVTMSSQAIGVDVVKFKQKLVDETVSETGSPQFARSFVATDDWLIVGAPDDSDTGQVYLYKPGKNNQSWEPFGQLLPADVVAGDQFGSVVKLTGEWLAVSAPNAGVFDNFGAVYMYRLDSSTQTWLLQQVITTSATGITGQFGFQMALSDQTLLVSEKEFAGVGVAPGTVYGYVLNQQTGLWSLGGELIPDQSGINISFGLDLDAVANHAYVSADRYSHQGVRVGAVYQFTFDANNQSWNQETVIVPVAGQELGRFGRSFKVDGSLMAVGAYNESNPNGSSGAVYVFQESSPGQWVQLTRTSPDDPILLYGYEVDMSGVEVLVSAPDFQSTMAGPGRVFLLTLAPGPIWVQVDELVYPGIGEEGLTAQLDQTASGLFYAVTGSPVGSVEVFQAVAGLDYEPFQTITLQPGNHDLNMGSDVDVYGSHLVMGLNPTVLQSMSNAELAYVYERIGGDWLIQQRLSIPVTEDELIEKVSVSLDADQLLVGIQYPPFSTVVGKALVFEKNTIDEWNQVAVLLAPDGFGGDGFAAAVKVSSDWAVVGAPNADGQTSQSGAAYLFHKDDNQMWQFVDKIIPEGAGNNAFGYSVDISNELVVVTDDSHDSTGAAFVFELDAMKNWNQIAVLEATDDDLLFNVGKSVAFADQRLLLGGNKNTSGIPGVVFEFTFNAGMNNWLQTGQFNPVNNQRTFGDQIDAADGELAVSAPSTSCDPEAKNEVYFYDLAPTISGPQRIFESQGRGCQDFGMAVAVSADVLLVGAPGDDTKGRNAGAGYLYDVVTDLIFANGLE